MADNVSAVGNVSATTDSTGTTTVSDTGQILGKDDFLKLLVTELKYQDPTAPTDDKEFIAEMAQFSSIEQLQNLNSSFSNLVTLQNLSQINFATNLVNHRVVGTDNAGVPLDGTVDNISFVNGSPCVVVGSQTASLQGLVKIY